MEQRTFQKYANEPNFVGYPLFYVVSSNFGTQLMCADCCTEEYTGAEDVTTEANWEDHQLYCHVCSDKIDAAYEEDDDDDSDDDTIFGGE